MCIKCALQSEPVEITEDRLPAVMAESTYVAIQTVEAFANRWFRAATGYMEDMGAHWGPAALHRMMYVFASAVHIFPYPDGAPPVPPGYDTAARALAERLGHDPDEHAVSRAVASVDQAHALVMACANHAVTGNADGVAKEMESASEDIAQHGLLLALSLAASLSNHADARSDEKSEDLFLEHVRRDLTPSRTEAEEGA